MSEKTTIRIGWVLSFILGLLFIMSSFMKISQNEQAMAGAAQAGFDASTYMMLGVIEFLALVLFLIPKTGVVGGLFLVAYMGGAIATHLQHHLPVAMPLVIEALLWIAMLLRFPELKQRILAPKKQVS
jgi:hypothetical protein